MDSRRPACPAGATDSRGSAPGRISMLFFVLGTFAGMFLLASQGFAEAHSSRSKHYPHRSRFSGPRAPRAPEPPEPSPFFDNGTSRNVTTSAGKAVFLPCKVRHLGDRTVSWIRRRDLHVLTVGRYTYTSDQRFQTIHMENSDSWMLQIQYPQKKDAGVYECQVSTLPKISRFVTLNVIVSKASIPGGPTLYLNSGSTLNLTCEIMESPMAPDFVFWYHNGRVINYELNNRGISIHTEKLPKTLSRLLISNAQPQDSGNYSCVPSNAEPADITVHVLNGEIAEPLRSSGLRGAPLNPDNDGGVGFFSGIISLFSTAPPTQKKEHDVTESQSTNDSISAIIETNNTSDHSANSATQDDDVGEQQANGFIGNGDNSTKTIPEPEARIQWNSTFQVPQTMPIKNGASSTQDEEKKFVETNGTNTPVQKVSGERVYSNESKIPYGLEGSTGNEDSPVLTFQPKSSYGKGGFHNPSSNEKHLSQLVPVFDELTNTTRTLNNRSTAQNANDSLYKATNSTGFAFPINHSGHSEMSGGGVSNDAVRLWIANLLKNRGFNLSMAESITNGSLLMVGLECNLGQGANGSVSEFQRFSKLCTNVTSAKIDALCSHIAVLTEFVSTLSDALRDVLLVLKACMSD